MNYAQCIREIGRGSVGARDMPLELAQQLYGAILDGGVPDLEMGAIAIALPFANPKRRRASSTCTMAPSIRCSKPNTIV